MALLGRPPSAASFSEFEEPAAEAGRPCGAARPPIKQERRERGGFHLALMGLPASSTSFSNFVEDPARPPLSLPNHTCLGLLLKEDCKDQPSLFGSFVLETILYGNASSGIVLLKNIQDAC